MAKSTTRSTADGELFESTGIDDNATSTAVTIDASENVTLANGAILKIKDAFGDTAMQFNVLSSGSNSGRINVDPDNTGANSQLSIYIDNSEKMVVNSSGNVGIGVVPEAWASNHVALQLGTGANIHGRTDRDAVLIGANNYNDGQWKRIGANGTSQTSLYEQHLGAHKFFTGASGTADSAISWTNAMTIDNSGNVGIGTSSPDSPLNVATTGGTFKVKPFGANGVEVYAPITLNSVDTGQSHRWQVGSTEAMRIDGSGNVLVGGTGAGASDSVTISGTGYIQARATGRVGYFDRLGSDGEIVMLRKDGSNVGSIGNVSADLIIDNSTASGGAGLALQNNSRVNPRLNQAFSDGTVDLGYSNSRWKDLYLSGGVYLGGTGSANKLDDFESGTWTPTGFSSGNIDVAKYTKVGDAVTVSLIVSGAVTLTSGTMGGLPFSGHTSACPWYSNGFAPGAGKVRTGVVAGSSVIFRVEEQSTGNYSVISDLTGTYLVITVTYHIP